MGLVRLGGGVIGISGSIGGTVFARNRFGTYVRPRTKPVNPNSILQAAVRGYLGLLTQKWHDTLDAAQRIAWNTYAAAVGVKNRIGDTVYLTGFNMYIRSNTVRLQLGQTQTPEGPTVLALPEKDPAFAISASVGTQLLTITLSTGLPWRDIAASVFGIWQGQPQLATRNFFGGPWKMAGSIPGNAVAPHTMAPSYTLVLGQKIWAYGRISTGPTDSRLSEPMYASCIVAD